MTRVESSARARRPPRGRFVGLAAFLSWALSLAGLWPAQARAATDDLILSEYVEGSGFNKAIEIYNGTGAAVDLDAGAYELLIEFNGGSSTTTLALTGSVADGGVYVVADDGADPGLLAATDLAATGNFFNGDDSVLLLKAGAVIDSFGRLGVDPGSEWPGGGANDTLRRKGSVCVGDTDAGDPFEASAEWDGFAQDDFSGLGVHAVDCGEAEPPPEEEPCGAPATFIHDVQGAGTASPIEGTLVSIEAVVTGDFQGSAGLDGFFVQEEDSDVDGDPQTSEGLFVFDQASAVNVEVGDIVRVRGTVAEFFDLTELTNVSSVQVCAGGASVTSAAAALPMSDSAGLEPLEGMQVSFAQTLFVTETFNQGRFGEVTLSSGARLPQPTAVATPGDAAIAQQAQNDLARVQLDDGSSVQNPALPPFLGLDDTLRGGDTVAGLVGVLGYAFGTYEVHPTWPVALQRANPRDELPASVGGRLKVASFNVLNYFTTIDAGAAGCGPLANLGCRGADSPAEFDRQRAKILEALSRVDAHIVGLVEMENDPASAALADVVQGLNDLLGPGTYASLDTGVIGTDAIQVAFIYQPSRVAPVGNFAVLDSSVDPRFLDQKNRPVLAQTFEERCSGERLTVAINHLKSKGSSCDDVEDPDTGDGQGNCNLTRSRAAEAQAAWLATDPTGSGDLDVLILGDLNSYAMEDPISALVDAGYHELLGDALGSDAYSFVFDGQWGYLDYALATSTLASQVTGVTAWHVNADEPRMLDYNQEFNPAFLYDPGPFRSSDHDPVVVGLQLDSRPRRGIGNPTGRGRHRGLRPR